jgi:hypothetical protein
VTELARESTMRAVHLVATNQDPFQPGFPSRFKVFWERFSELLFRWISSPSSGVCRGNAAAQRRAPGGLLG